MCGIAGILNLRGPGPISVETLKRMAGTLRHRGPDEAGIYVDDQAGLTSARLSIIDLRGGTQPIHNEEESLWIVQNGEIFNYLELGEDLRKRGHRFYTATDTEVILHLYEEKGASCLEDLNGQFALAIWDAVKGKLLLARDRVGILPLHYAVQGGRLFFASEVKAILAADGMDRALDPMALDQIFTFWTHLPGRTFFKGIREIPPGHFLEWADGKMSLARYWDISFSPPAGQLDLPLPEICRELGRVLMDSVRLRLRADVPVGCYLSGGLDSTGLTAMVKKHAVNPPKTFGIRFEETAFDEGGYQEEAVRFLGTEHDEVRVKNEEIGSFFQEVLWHCEKPLLRTAPVPLFLLARRVRRDGLKVVLTGEGADEVFGGYNIFRETKVRRFWARQPESSWRPALIQRLYPYIFNGGNRKAGHFLKSFFGAGLDRAEDPFFSHRIRWENTARTKTFFSDDLRAQIGDDNPWERLQEWLPDACPSWDSLSRAQYLEMILFMSNYLLSCQGDRVAMAHGVEVRPPYLDHRIIEFMGRVPPKWKILGLDEKYILKKTFQGLVPENILARAKHPYRAPIKSSLLKGGMEWAEDMLSERFLKEAGLFDPQKVKRLVRKLEASSQAGEVDSMALAGILSSQVIFRQFVAHFPYHPADSVEPALFFDRRSRAADLQSAFPETTRRWAGKLKAKG
jgi:asparagine synthase (glutamine-hydrolysing)